MRASLTPAIRYRCARPGDLEALARVEERSFTRDRFPRRNLRRLLKSATATFVIAEEAGAAAGYAMLLFRKGSRVARLYSIAVDPAFRSKGIGESLLREAAELARARGAASLRLELRSSNRRAQRLYQRAGYVLLGRKPGYYGDGEDAIRMELSLASDAAGDRSAHS